MGEAKHKNIRIAGKVQGVGFRISTRQKAREIGVNGFVRNEPDGSVYIEAEAEPEVLEQFIAWCESGPGPAIVQAVNIEEDKVQEYAEFLIKYS